MKHKWNCDSSNGHRNRRGFTLVEMLLVLCILALLAALVYPRLIHRYPIEQSKVVTVQIKSFEQALQMFALDTGALPKGKNGLNDLLREPRDVKNWHGPYLESIPLDPWGNPYAYECPGKHRPASFDLISAGPDGQVGTPDDIVNWPTNGPTAVTAR